MEDWKIGNDRTAGDWKIRRLDDWMIGNGKDERQTATAEVDKKDLKI